MRSRSVRRASFSLVAAFLCTLGLTSFIDRTYFDSSKVRALFSSIPPQESNLPDSDRKKIAGLVRQTHTTIDWQLSRQLLSQLDPRLRTPTQWQAEWLLWYFEVKTRFSSDERLAIYCHLMPFKGGQGLLYRSHLLFQKEPSQLADEELAQIIAVQIRGPIYYELHPERLAADGQALLRSRI